MLDKLVALTGVTFAEGCCATLPYTATTSQHQQPTTNDDVDEVKVDRRMLDKLLAMAGVTFAEGCYATLPCTATTSQHQRPTTTDDDDDEISVYGAERMRQQLFDVSDQSGVLNYRSHICGIAVTIKK